MSNIITKQYITTTTVIPGYTKKVWVPGYTNTYTAAWGYYTNEAGQQIKVYAQPGDVVVDGKFTTTIIDTFGGSTVSILVAITVVGEDVTTETVAGHYEYVTVEDQVVYSYSPNLGWNSSAFSVPELIADGTFSWYMDPAVKGVVTGLNETYDAYGVGYVEITFGFLFNNGYYRVIESGTTVTGAYTYTSADKFAVVRINGAIYYTVNDVVFYKSNQTSTLELIADCSLYAAGDSIIDAAMSSTSTIQVGSADCVATHSMDVEPKAAANILDNDSSLVHDGLYSIDDEVHSTATISSSNGNTLLVLKDWGGASITNSNTLTGSAHNVIEARVSIYPMQVFAASGYEYYNYVDASITKMSVNSGSGVIMMPLFNGMIAAMEQMDVGAHAAQGVTNTSGTMTFAEMQMFSSQTEYAFVDTSFKSMYTLAASFERPDVYAYLNGFTSTVSGHGTPENATASLEGFTSTVEGYSGAQALLLGFVSTLGSTATPLFTGAGELTGFTSTLDSSATNLYLGDGSLHGFISTITAEGGAIAALDGFTITLAGTATNPLLADSYLDGFVSTVTATGTAELVANASLTGFTSTLTWVTGSLSGFVSTVSSTASQSSSHAIAYNFNINTEEMTKYTSYDFSHIIGIGGKFYGVKSNGLYLLEGASDNGTNFKGSIETKETDFGTFQKKRVQYVYLNSDKPTRITAYADGVAGQKQTSQFGGRRTQLGAGPIGRYWKFKIDEISKLEGAEFIPIASQRKI